MQHSFSGLTLQMGFMAISRHDLFGRKILIEIKRIRLLFFPQKQNIYDGDSFLSLYINNVLCWLLIKQLWSVNDLFILNWDNSVAPTSPTDQHTPMYTSQRTNVAKCLTANIHDKNCTCSQTCPIVFCYRGGMIWVCVSASQMLMETTADSSVSLCLLLFCTFITLLYRVYKPHYIVKISAVNQLKYLITINQDLHS